MLGSLLLLENISSVLFSNPNPGSLEVVPPASPLPQQTPQQEQVQVGHLEALTSVNWPD